MLKYFLKFCSKRFRNGTIINNKGGRNHRGRICVRGRKAVKHLYKKLDFYRRIESFGFLIRILKDVNRSCYLALVLYENGICCYIAASHETTIDIYSGTIPLLNFKMKFPNGWAVPLRFINLFSIISNIELKVGQGFKLIRAAGNSSIIIGKNKKEAILKLKSGWQVKLPLDCMASIGAVSNPSHKFENLGSAGKKRIFGFRSKSRGIAKNPCDHPHGGGNGKKSAPPVPVNFTGRVKKWEHSKKKKRIILKRREFFKKKW